MQQINIHGTALRVSRLIFGTGSLFNAGSARDRQRLLSAACDMGFTHFDTAPYYGFGLAESDLGFLLKARPDVTVATKVGLYAPGGEDQPEATVFARKALGRLLRFPSRAQVDWTVTRARKSLDDSLRRLKRDKVDLYLLHEPDPRLFDTEEWLRWLETETGRVSAFGVAPAPNMVEHLVSNELARVIQARDSLKGEEANPILASGRALQITYGYLSAALPKNADDAADTLRRALRRNPTGAIIVSTTQLSRLQQYPLSLS